MNTQTRTAVQEANGYSHGGQRLQSRETGTVLKCGQVDIVDMVFYPGKPGFRQILFTTEDHRSSKRRLPGRECNLGSKHRPPSEPRPVSPVLSSPFN